MALYRIRVQGIYKLAGRWLMPAPSDMPLEEVWPETKEKFRSQHGAAYTILWRIAHNRPDGFWEFNLYCWISRYAQVKPGRTKTYKRIL